MNGGKEFLTFPRIRFVSLTCATAITREISCVRVKLWSCLASFGSTECEVVFAVQYCRAAVLMKKKKRSTALDGNNDCLCFNVKFSSHCLLN